MKVPLRLAGVEVEVQVDELADLGPRAERFVPFMAPAVGSPFSLTVHAVGGSRVSLAESAENYLRWARRGRLLHFESGLEQAYVSLDKGKGEIWVRPGGGVENFLRLFLALECLSKGGLLLHASGVVIEGKAYLFFGHSGSGKSTIAGLAPQGQVLGDDVVALRLGAGGPRAYALPFGHRPGAANIDAPLARLYRLRHSHVHRLRRLSHAVGAAELVSCAPFIHDDPGLQRQALETAQALGAQAPVEELGFAPDPSVWPFLLRRDGRPSPDQPAAVPERPRQPQAHGRVHAIP